MATSGFQFHSGNPQVVMLPEAATQSFVAGDLVYLVGGKVTICANDGTIFGVALKNATTTTDSDIPVQIIQPFDIWRMEMDTTLAVAQVGEDYGLTVSSGDSDIKSSETAQTAVTVLSLYDDVGTTTRGRVLANFLAQNLQHWKGTGHGAL